jgi:hypothetical protein
MRRCELDRLLRRMSRGRLLSAVLALVGAGVGLPPAGAWADAPDAPQAETVIELFGREDCPHCNEAGDYLHELARERPGLRILRRDVVRDRAALERLRTLATSAGLAQAAVPAVYVRGRLFIGFDDAETTGKAIESWLDEGRSEAGARAGAICATSPVEPCEQAASDRRHALRLPILGEVDARELGLPLFTIAVGAIDGFNPCAMWVLLFLLSMLVHLQSRARMAVIAGTFVLVSGLVYYAFMAAWLNFFLLVGISRAIQIGLGVIALAVGAVHVKDFFAFRRGVSFGIPDAAKPGIYRRVRAVLYAEHLAGALGAIVVLAAMVNLVELLCTAGLPALYTEVLASQRVFGAGYYAYLALYNVFYMLDDAVMLAVAVVTLSQHKLQERGGRVLKLISGLVMAALGVVLVFAPQWLSWR